jgi:hypothetical protein
VPPGLLSDTRAITTALIAGDAAGEQTQSDDLAGGWFLFPAAEQSLHAADAHTSLGDGHQAEHHAQRAIARYQDVPTDDLFVDNLHCARAIWPPPFSIKAKWKAPSKRSARL